MTAVQTQKRKRCSAQRLAKGPPPPPQTDRLARWDAALVQNEPYEDASAIRSSEAAIDAALEMTFPASDPPAWTL
jgi:hypothetical protein